MDLESWNSNQAYEQYVGRWSRRVAVRFLDWLALPPGLTWADAGCGTGALTSTILARAAPAAVVAVDYSHPFLRQARVANADRRAGFVRGDAAHLPWKASVFEAVVSGLVLNFVREPAAMVQEMRRVTKPGGRVAAYVWDYGGGMQMMRHFWEAAIAVSPGDAGLDQAERFPLCQPEPLRALFEGGRLRAVEVEAVDIPTSFRNFDDFWQPFLGQTGAAPTYLAAVGGDVREKIRRTLKERLTPEDDRPIELSARAWAVTGVV